MEICKIARAACGRCSRSFIEPNVPGRCARQSATDAWKIKVEERPRCVPVTNSPQEKRKKERYNLEPVVSVAGRSFAQYSKYVGAPEEKKEIGRNKSDEAETARLKFIPYFDQSPPCNLDP
jgi:hypothetical protein